MHHNHYIYILGLKWANIATQTLIEMKVRDHLQQSCLKDLVNHRNKSHKVHQHHVRIGPETVMDYLSYYAPKTATTNDGQYDTSNLKHILARV